MRIVALMLALVPTLGLPSTPSSPGMTKATAGPEEVWHMTLPEAIRIGLDNSEPVTCLRIGAQEIPLGGFEPTVVATVPAGGGSPGPLHQP